MNYLAIDTSSTYLTVALCYNGNYYGQSSSCGLTHSVTLNKTIEEVLEQANITFNDLDFFAVVVGAGSFTGIRIGISTVKAFSFATDKPVLAVTSFDVIAYNTDMQKVATLIDARNGNYYCRLYDNGVAKEPYFANIAEIENLGYKIVKAEQVDLYKGLILAVENNLKNIGDRETLVPLYCKKSQAEEC